MDKSKLKITWRGAGVNTKGYNKNNNVIIECNKKYFRPTEVNSLLGDPRKARTKLNWRPKFTINSLVDEMINFEKKLIRKND